MNTDMVESATLRRYLRIADVCAMMGGLSRRHVENLIDTGKLPAFRPSHKVKLVRYEDVVRYVEGEPVAEVALA
jgi:excisionase family DNA binding protein